MPLHRSDLPDDVLALLDAGIHVITAVNIQHLETLNDAVARAKMPRLRKLLQDNARATRLKAHGTAVGLPTDDDMGNSEVGHNALGAGRVFDQGAKRVAMAIASGEIWKGPVWNAIVERIPPPRAVMSNSFAFGGSNAALVLGRVA